MSQIKKQGISLHFIPFAGDETPEDRKWCKQCDDFMHLKRAYVSYTYLLIMRFPYLNGKCVHKLKYTILLTWMWLIKRKHAPIQILYTNPTNNKHKFRQ